MPSIVLANLMFSISLCKTDENSLLASTTIGQLCHCPHDLAPCVYTFPAKALGIQKLPPWPSVAALTGEPPRVLRGHLRPGAAFIRAFELGGSWGFPV